MIYNLCSKGTLLLDGKYTKVVDLLKSNLARREAGDLEEGFDDHHEGAYEDEDAEDVEDEIYVDDIPTPTPDSPTRLRRQVVARVVGAARTVGAAVSRAGSVVKQKTGIAEILANSAWVKYCLIHNNISSFSLVLISNMFRLASWSFIKR